jgi:hypothetical protein
MRGTNVIPALAGTYLGAATVYAGIMKRSPVDLSYTAGLPVDVGDRHGAVNASQRAFAQHHGGYGSRGGMLVRTRTRQKYPQQQKVSARLKRYVEIRLQDGGMHFVAWLRGGRSDAEIAEHLHGKGIGPAPLSRCSLKVSGHNGLMIGYTNVAKENAASATRQMLGATQGIR